MLDWDNGEISTKSEYQIKAQQFYTHLDPYQQC